MNTVSVKTTTTISKKGGNFKIHCFSDKDVNGNTNPDIFSAKILNEVEEIDGVLGKEGELMLMSGNKNGSNVNKQGQLVISSESDDVNKYSKQGEDLIYEG